MTSNILPFSRRAEKSASEELGSIVRNSFLAMRDPESPTRVGIWYAMENFAHQPQMLEMPVTYWAWNDFDYSAQDPTSDGESDFPSEHHSFTISSDVRPMLVPEFGHQENRTFLSLTSSLLSATPIERRQIDAELKASVIEGMLCYWESFPQDLVPSERMNFQGTILECLLTSPDLHYISHGVDASKFSVTFYNQIDDGIAHELIYTIDMLPILMDASAFRWAGAD